MNQAGDYLILAALIAIVALIFLVLLDYTRSKKKSTRVLKEEFRAEDYMKSLRFEYKGYTVLASPGRVVEIAIVHDRSIKDVKAPRGMKLTPMFLVMRVRKAEKIRERLDEAIEFLNSIPTR